MLKAIGNIIKTFYVAIYIRLSKEDANLGESESITNQKTLLTKYVEEQGYVLVDIYIDDGYTGTNFNRPAFQRMLKDIETGKVNMVITKDLSRLSRDYIGTGEYVEKWFPAHGVRYVALTDNIDTMIDSTNNDIAPFKAILNDMYAKDLSKKIRSALHTMQTEGKWVGGCPPLGYKVDPNDKNHLVINEIEQPIVKRIFDLFLSGKKINEIKNIFNEEKVPTFSSLRKRNFKRKGSNGNIYGYWTNTTIKKILTNRLYTGDMIQNRRSRISYKYRKIVYNPKEQWIIVENTHEPIIDKKSFKKIQKILPKQKSRDDKKEEFLFDGLLKCADCGHTIGIKSRDKYGNAYTVCNFYRRFKKELGMCTSHGNNYDRLEKELLETIKQILIHVDIDDITAQVRKKYNGMSTVESIQNNINKLENEIQLLKDSLDSTYIDKVTKKISEEMYNRVEKRINNNIELKEKKLNEAKEYLEKLKYNEPNSKELKKMVKEFLELKTPKRNLILGLIENIFIHEDGNIDIKFNFKELNIINESYST